MNESSQKFQPEFQLSDILKNTSDLVLSVDSDGKIQYVNNAWINTLGYTAEEATSKFIDEVIHPESLPHCRKIMDEIFDVRYMIDVPMTLKSRFGEKVLTRATVNCRYNSDGSYGGTQAIFKNITKAVQANRMAVGKERLYKMLVESANDGIYHSDQSGFMIYMNKRGKELLGYDFEEIIGEHFVKFVDKRKELFVKDFYHNQFKTKEEVTYLEFPVKRKDGSKIWVGQNVRAIFDGINKDRIDGYIGVFRDITEKRIEEEQLRSNKLFLEHKVSERTIELELSNKKLLREVSKRRESESKFKRIKSEYEKLFQNAHDAIIVFRAKDEVVLEANLKACKLYGFDSEDFIGTSLKTLIDKNESKELIKKTLNSESDVRFTTEQLTKTGRKLIIEVAATPILYNGQKAIITINRDVTKTYELNEQLEMARKQQMHALVNGQEMERKRMAQELHDGIGQMLTSLVRMLRKIEQDGNLSSSQGIQLRESEVLVDSIIDETRRISRNLMPSILTDFGLDAALRSIMEYVAKAGYEAIFNSQATIPRLDNKVEIGIYRIVQEAITNSIKHSRAFKITLNSILETNSLRIEVIDDGLGFDLDKENIRMKGNGISHMIERANLIGAVLDIDTERKKGVKISINYQLNGENKHNTS